MICQCRADQLFNNFDLLATDESQYRKIPKISPSMYKPPEPVTQKPLR